MTGFPSDHPGAEVRPSPNFGVRRGVPGPDAIVLHYTGMPTAQGAEDWLCNPASEVSCHYVLHEDGRIVQLVRESDRAWHAGKSFWAGRDDLNSRSVGIEIVNPGHGLGYPDFSFAQMTALVPLLRGIMARHGIAASRVLAHSDVAPGRKVDPGEKFPWAELASHGLALFVEPAPDDCAGPRLRPGDLGAEVLAFQRGLARAGYGVEPTGVFDGQTAAVTAAFQRRHRPARFDGVADASTIATLHRLLAAMG